jgi:diamine N-acetyltransferase
VLLRKLLEKDAPYMLEWMTDEECNRFFRFDASLATRESVSSFIKEAQSGNANCHYAIADDQDEYLGTVSLKAVDVKNSNAEYAIALRKCAMGRGIGAWATNEILRVAFEDMRLEKVYLNVMSVNARAIRLYEKMGFRLEGEFKSHVLLAGCLKDLRWYAMLRGEWFGRKAQGS